MDHIFGDSHDIAFGGNSAKNTNTFSPAAEKKSSAGGFTRPRIAEKPFHKGPSPEQRRHLPAVSAAEPIAPKEPLQALLDGMKPTFLPKDEDIATLRLVILSEATSPDPLFLLSSKEESLLVGTGFSSISRAGKIYPTFPDMRLVASEKTKIQGWILPHDVTDFLLVASILPVLDFPPLYASRSTIAKLRENIKDTELLARCRFFEIFPEGQNTRRIGDFELTKDGVSFSLRFRETLLSFDPNSHAHFSLSRKNAGYILAHETVLIGEILSLRGKHLTKNPLKFTFDTFYLDAGSVGLIAGYTLGDRELLAENGVLTFTLEEDKRLRTIVGHIFIDSRGFVHAHEMMSVHKEILKGIRATYEKCIVENPKIERAVLVQSLRREITKYCYLLTKRTPVVLPILIER